jgi:hypothetical protein
MFPGTVFDPYTGFAENDSPAFIKATKIVYINSVITGFIILCIPPIDPIVQWLKQYM